MEHGQLGCRLQHCHRNIVLRRQAAGLWILAHYLSKEPSNTFITKAQCLQQTFDIIIMSSAAEYCKSCEFPFKQMGACPMPEKSMFWAYLSMLPYVLPIIIFLSCILLKNMSQFKLSSMLASSYISGDKLVKNLIKNPRPPHSCKSSYGMPSSHMVVMAAFTFWRFRDGKCTTFEKCFWVLVTIAEGFARVQLNYHTFEQVIAGVAYGVAYALVFEKLWTLVAEPRISQYLSSQSPRESIQQSESE